MAAWSIRRKLGLLVTIPLVVLLIGGGVIVTSLTLQYRQAHTARQDADAMLPTLSSTVAMLYELTSTSSDKATVTGLRANTDSKIATLRPVLKRLSQQDPNNVNGLALQSDAVTTSLAGLPNIRKSIDALIANNTLNSEAGTRQVSQSSATLLTAAQNLVQGLSDDLSLVSTDREISSGAGFVSALSTLGVAAAGEATLIDGVLRPPAKDGTILGDDMSPDRFATLQEFITQELQASNDAASFANFDQKKKLQELTDTTEGRLNKFRSNMTTLLTNNDAPRNDLKAWDQLAVGRLGQIAELDQQAAVLNQSNARSAETSGLIRVAAVTGAVLLTLLVVTALLATIARTVTVPLRRLRAGAVDVASVQLPAAVARIEQDGINADISLPPVLPADAYAGPETLEVARAVDDLGAEAVRLATAQVRLRRALDEAFVSMSRRSQSMVEKQLAIIDELESQEQDPDQLRNLFRLDHLAARMRRYNDNLLVLAGSAVRTRATAPVKIAELFRAATSEMEQYERVRLQPVSGASVAGTVAGELVHLLAELLDNAAMYSPPSSAIVLSAAFTADAGLQIEVLDAGVGISPGELDRLNGRLSQPESIDTQVPSRMGLFVVARLARRGSFGVMLQARPDASGTIALVRVPATLVIGAPGSTGEMPSIQPPAARPAIAQDQNWAESSRQTGQFAAFAPPAGLGQVPSTPVPAGMPAPAAAAAGVAAEAAAGVRTVGESSSAALPRRRRAAAGGPNAGLPAEAIAAAANPATGLFTPIVAPAEEPTTGERPRSTGAAAFNRTQAPPPSDPTPTPLPPLPPATSPTGMPGLSLPPLPARNPSQQPYNARPWEAAPFSTPGAPPSTDSPFLPHRQPEPRPQQPISESHFDTPAAGITGLPGLAPPVRRGATPPPPSRIQQPEPQQQQTFAPPPSLPPLPARPQPQPQQPAAFADPLTSPAGVFRTAPNQTVPQAPNGNGNGSSDWDDDLPTELAARAAAAASYRPTDPNLPMIGDDVRPDFNDPTPIFDQISVWFTAEPDDGPTVSTGAGGDQVIDLREQDERRPSSRWASLGDQRWLATNARAAAAPDTEGTTETGLPKRRPGANLLPSSATTAAPPINRPAARPMPVRQTAADGSGDGLNGGQSAQEAAIVRGRLGSYQRGLANARRARTQPTPAPAFDPVGASLFTVNSEAGENAGRHSGEQGGDQ